MGHKPDESTELKSITVRLPEKDYMVIREYADSRAMSMNAVISDAVAEYGVKVQRQKAFERIRALRESQRKRSGPRSDSVALLRELREERSEPRGGKHE